jgi:integrase
MSRRGSRRRIDTGIYEDLSGISITAKVGTGAAARQREARYPFGTALRTLKNARANLRERLRAEGPEPAAAGTFEADVDQYLKTVPEGRSRIDAKNLLNHWLDAPGFRSISRHRITSLMISKQLTAWVDAELAGSTVNKRRTALMSFFRVLDGAGGRNPVREVPRQHEENEEARGFDYGLVEKIIRALPDRSRPIAGQDRGQVSLTKMRLRAIAYTGFPHAVLSKIQPHQLRLDDAQPSVDTMPRRKGKRTKPKRIPLNDRAVAAFRDLLEANALGTFSASSMRMSFRRAVKAVKTQWVKDELESGTRRPWPLPENAHPYDLRHAFGSETLRRTGDLQATSELMLHSDIRTTMRYLRSAVSEQAQKGADAWNPKGRKAGTKAGTNKKAS